MFWNILEPGTKTDTTSSIQSPINNSVDVFGFTQEKKCIIQASLDDSLCLCLRSDQTIILGQLWSLIPLQVYHCNEQGAVNGSSPLLTIQTT